MQTVIIENVRKSYGSKVAVEAFTARVEQGITALLGPNGAGKSTLFRMIAGLTQPQRGTITVLGINPYKAHRQVAAKIGVLPERNGLFENVTAARQLELYARLFGTTSEQAKKATIKVLDKVDLLEDADIKAGEFSQGMCKRLAIARALINNPEILLLDEPTEGLDPIQVMKLRELMLKLRDEGRTIMYNTHNLSEVAKVADQIIVMQKGIIKFDGSREAFQALSGSSGDSLEVMERAYQNILLGKVVEAVSVAAQNMS